ncbi:hypothetical protein U6B65_03125 [Oscillospiraceae bacterium MB08-C2-2]|nr:hypothetical protein U6B65_03125 [Oscillospiraceae bacterium MB08-C2-2]
MKRKAIIWISACFLGLLLGILKGYFDWPDAVFWKIYLTIGAAAIVGAYLFNLIWYRRFAGRINALLPILREEKNPDRYIEENQKLLEGLRPQGLRAVLHINLCAAYCQKKEFDRAKEQLGMVNPKYVRKLNRVIYLMDMAYVHFYLGEQQEALAAMEENRKGLQELAESESYGSLVCVLHVFEALAQEKNSRAAELLDMARQKWPGDQLLEELDILSRKNPGGFRSE